MRRLALALAAMVLAGCGAADGGDAIADYCSYGAVSEAQLDGCIEHVTSEDYETRDTNAARYARGVLDECLADAGPFCEDR